MERKELSSPSALCSEESTVGEARGPVGVPEQRLVERSWGPGLCDRVLGSTWPTLVPEGGASRGPLGPDSHQPGPVTEGPFKARSPPPLLTLLGTGPGHRVPSVGGTSARAIQGGDRRAHSWVSARTPSLRAPPPQPS